MSKPAGLAMWTVYFDPQDFPCLSVVRRFIVAGGEPVVDPEPCFVGLSLEVRVGGDPAGSGRVSSSESRGRTVNRRDVGVRTSPAAIADQGDVNGI